MPTIRRRKHSTIESDNEIMPKRRLRQTKQVNYAVDSSDDEQPPRKSRILPTHRVKKNNQRAFNHNAANSRLLKLPGELRDIILRLLLCGRTIHIYTENAKQSEQGLVAMLEEDDYLPEEIVEDSEEENSWLGYSDDEDDDEDYAYSDDERHEKMQKQKTKMRQQHRIRHSVCVATPTDAEDISTIKAERPDDRSTDHDTWGRRHRRCRHAFHKSLRPRQPLDVALLAVCRQLHKEVALLHFQENNFCFRKMGVLGTFLTKMIPSQLHAIQHITIAYPYDLGDYSRKSIETKLKTGFQSLESLTIILDSDSHWKHPETRYCIFADLMQFKKVELKSVTVQARVTCDDLRLELDEFEGWAADLQEMLKKDWNTKDKTELAALRQEARDKFGFDEKWT